MRNTYLLGFLALALPFGCSKDVEVLDDGGDGIETGETGDGDGSTGDDGETTGDEDDGGPKLDVGPGDIGGPGKECKVPEDGDSAPGSCDEQAPPDSFDSKLEWEWEGEDDTYSIAMPLVANLTDDDQNGEIDLCDIPDVVTLAFPADAFDLENPEKIWETQGHLHVLDGATGNEHWASDPVTWWGQPALADIDGDGQVEVLAPKTLIGPLGAWNHDGTPMEGWDESYTENVDLEDASFNFAAAIAVADLDQDGDPEIVVGPVVYDNDGTVLATLPTGAGGAYRTTTLVDLDQDGAMEILTGRVAYTYMGGGAYETFFDNDEVGTGHPHVADLDADGDPEILISSGDGVSVLDHAGNTVIANDKPVMGDGNEAWGRPAAIHDFDGDGQAEWSVSVGDQYLLLQLSGDDPSISVEAQWDVLDLSGLATGTAFDFLGDGSAEAMYGDENWLWVFDTSDDQLPALVQQERTSRTLIEYPVVADVDDDGSAEIIVVSNENIAAVDTSPTVQVFGDADDRWIQARRIWNQHSYHVTNVREDGTIPQVESPHWESFNTFRTNAQIEGGATCIPEG